MTEVKTDREVARAPRSAETSPFSGWDFIPRPGPDEVDCLGGPPLSPGEPLFAARLQGDSMEPKFHEGDFLLCQGEDVLIKSGDYAFAIIVRKPVPGRKVRVKKGPRGGTCVRGAAVLKQFFRLPDRHIRLVSLNPKHPPMVLGAEQLFAMYRVRARFRKQGTEKTASESAEGAEGD